MSQDELHVVFGTGPVGLAIMDVLAARGKRVRAVNRSGQANVPAGVEVRRGDAASVTSARELCQGATHVYNCTNARDYHRWPEQFPPLQAGILAGAAAAGAKLIVMDNLYMVGPHGGVPMTEDLPYNGKGPRSSTRKQMALDLMAAHHAGEVRVTVGRASDFFGPRVGESMAGERLFRPAMAGKTVQTVLSPDVPHTFTYVPDIGQALVILGERDEALGQVWHIPSPRTVTPREFIRLAAEAAGQQARIFGLPRLMLPLLGLVIPAMRGIGENDYMYHEPYILDHSKFARAFGDALQPTPLEEAIRTTVQWYQAHPA